MNDTNTSESYDEHFRTDPGRWAKPRELDFLIRDVIKERRANRKISVLDMGCGQGRTINVIKTPNMAIQGIDFSEEALKLARVTNPECKFVCWDMALQLTCPPGLFAYWDVILSAGSHEHIRRIDFSVPYNILTYDGLFLCVLPCCETSIGWGKTGPQHEWKLSRDEWTRHLGGDGFIIEPEIKHKWLFVCSK